MEDRRIVELYWKRDERALEETQRRYGAYCYSIAHGILHSREDALECENDTYLEAWRSIPPHKPDPLGGFLGMITRRLSLDRWRRKNAHKRGGGEVQLSFNELEEIIPNGESIESSLRAEVLAQVLNRFLRRLPKLQCNVFLRRYWYFDSVEQICQRYGLGESRVKMMLKRSRDRLRQELEKEGIIV